MEKARKKELQQQYMQAKHPMGVFIIRSKVNNKCYIQSTPDLRGVMNGAYVRLDGGRHPNKELQKEWNEFGAGSFEIEILEQLQYDEKDEEKSDYSEELTLLQMIWEEKLAGRNMEFYKKRIT
ncbi:GIY-YIG nuclease family protein [Ruminiclostridium cellobioparum]|jgi:hypothetical protein|uniref:GIY-YIG domain-containing protein n=1 Tax=Ruminiclostridium cellobioparum subsp. termitidis CT1112 TaxID=1195236 RepID=S0FHI3_RUMCE|nr:GIY-YIG nuclease family protein [Ruminiclostridium cellobioparum]EMS69331.1 hypothetical protein CTER_5088 [Ruminiclostridium cellobioparum subsp. termitidis CT1112]